MSEGVMRRLAEGRRPAVLLAFGLLLLVGLARPNAAAPDLGPRGWAPGILLPLVLSPAAVTATLWLAYLAAGLVVALAFTGRAGPPLSWRVPGALAMLALFTAPFGSADHLNYVAYGRILLGGGDPWLESPVDWKGGTDPITSHVEEPWTTEPSVYGPVASVAFAAANLLGGESLRQVVWAWQVVVVLAWLGIRWLLRHLVSEEQHGAIDALWTLNPLVFGVGVLGAHVDILAAAFVVAAVVAAVRWPGLGGALTAGVLVAFAGSTKITYAVVLAGLLAASWWGGRRGRVWMGVLVGTALGLLVLLHLWAGPHVFDQLARSRQAISFATAWRLVFLPLSLVLGDAGARGVVAVLAPVAALTFAVLIARLALSGRAPSGLAPSGLAPTDRPGLGPIALGVTGVLVAAYGMAAPYSLPWYDVLVWAALPAMITHPTKVTSPAGGGQRSLGHLLTVRLTVLAMAYVPGRVLGSTAGVTSLTLGFRQYVGPIVALLVWGWLIRAGRAAPPLSPWLRRPQPGPRADPPGSAGSPGAP